MPRLERMLALVRRHRPELVLVDKHERRWMRGIGTLLHPVMPDFMTAVTTVVGDTVYLPAPADQMAPDRLARILAHELVHQLDQAEHGAWFYASYAVFPAPFGRTRRAHWERRAYAVDLMIAHADGGEAGMERTRRALVHLFSGPAYGWMWAGRASAERFLQPVVDEILAGELQRRPPYADILEAWVRGAP